MHDDPCYKWTETTSIASKNKKRHSFSNNMFSWSTNFQDLYQLQDPDSDSVAFNTNFASDELSLDQPNVVSARDNTTSTGAQVRPQLASSIQNRGNAPRLEPVQREEILATM
jgi:hypothetical protein